MRKVLVSVGAASLAALLATACGADPDEPTNNDGNGAADSATVTLGASLCLTGIQAPLDEPGLRGAKLAVKQLNEDGGILGKQVKLINLDGKSDPVTVGNNAVQLIDEGAAAIIAPCDFDFGSPASREAQSAGLVGISTCASSPLYGAESLGDKQFTLSMWNTTMGAAAAEHGYEQGWRDAYVVTDTFIDYTKSLSAYFIETWEHLGGTIVGTDTYTQGDQNFSAQLQRLQDAPEPDVIFVSSYMPDLALIIREIRAAGIDAPILGGDSYDDPQLGKVLGNKYGNDITYATHSYLSAQAGDQIGEFLQAYQDEYGEEPDTAMVTTGYDTVMVLAQAMEEAGTTEGAEVAKAMETMQFDLLTGQLDWDTAAEDHLPDKEAAMVSLSGGETEFEGWLMPSWTPEK
jgi:branched-chain amino acid transport system substrate-binding protein